MNRPAIAPSDGAPPLARAAACHGLAGLSALAAALVICTSKPALAQITPPAAGPLRVAALAAAPTAATPAADGPTSAAVPQSYTHDRLFSLAKVWVEKDQQLPADQIQFAKLDSRVRIADCSTPLQFDYPFSSSRETLRVRCAQPSAWQLFLRLLGPAAVPALQASPASNSTGPASRTSTPVTAQMPTKTVVVAKRLLQRGNELNATMLEEVQRPALGLDPLAITSLKDVDRAEAVRDIPAGTVLRSYDIKRSLMVRRGQSALLTVGQNGNFQVTVRVEAEQDGYLGEQIRLKNPESGRLISGVVTGPNALKGL